MRTSTDAYTLNAEYAIHVATIDLNGSADWASIRNLTRNKLSWDIATSTWRWA